MVFGLGAFAFAGGLSGSADAQTPPTNFMEMQSRLEAAQANASRAGDAALTCDRLESELITTANDPALQSFVSRSGVIAKEKMDATKAASGRAATQTALTVISSVVPGGAMPGFLGMAAQTQAQQPDAARNIQQNMQQMQDMIAILPQLTRGQRVIELAQARNCDWSR